MKTETLAPLPDGTRLVILGGEYFTLQMINDIQ